MGLDFISFVQVIKVDLVGSILTVKEANPVTKYAESQ